MSALANIVVADATPANHTFVPLQRNLTDVLFVERSAVSPALDMKMKLTYDPATSKRVTDRVGFQFDYPTTQVVDGVTVLRSTAHAYANLVVPADLTATERGHFAAELKSFFATAIWEDYAKDRDPML